MKQKKYGQISNYKSSYYIKNKKVTTQIKKVNNNRRNKRNFKSRRAVNEVEHY